MRIQEFLLLCVVLPAAAKVQTPHFNYSSTTKLLLNWDDVWEVGDIGALAILREGMKVTVWLRVAGDTGVGLRRLLSFKCPMASTQDTLDLDSLSSVAAVKRCSDTLPFKIAKLDTSIDKFQLSIGESRLAYSEVFKESLELMVRVEFPSGNLKSKPLRVWSLDTLRTPGSASASPDFARGFLTDKAVNFATRIGSTTDAFSSVDFLDPGVVKAIAEAPEFFRAKLNLGMILYFDSSSCITYQQTNSILLVNYNSKMDHEHQNLAKLFYLNLRDGKLSYSMCGLSREVKSFFEKRRPEFSIGICTIVSITGDSEPYVKTDSVRLRIPLSEVAYQGCNSTATSRNCEVAPNVSTIVTVVSGMDNTAIVCPIMCNDKSEVYRFFRNGKPLIGSLTDEWSLVDGVRVSKTGNIIEFPPAVTSGHSGVYRCDAGSKQFSFSVTVVSLPHFSATAAGSGLLPEKVFAMEGESLAYSCTANFASLSSVNVSPLFHVATTTSGKLSWQSLNQEAFRLKVAATEKSLSVNTSTTNDSQTLTVMVTRVPPANPSMGTNFSHRFECDASVGPDESQLVGMSEYRVQSRGSELIFVPRLTLDSFVLNPSNNCSVQRCLLGKGAFFEFRLTEETTNYLRDIGVEVAPYLRLDDVLLSDVSVLFRGNASSMEVDSVKGRLAYRIQPVSSEEVMNELVGRSRITPVFNLLYRTGTQLGSLRMLKAAYGESPSSLAKSDCRADPLCFYSTDFDVQGALSFLPVAITFERPPELERVAGASANVVAIIIGILAFLIALAVIIYLATKKSGRTYEVAEMDLQHGYNPQEEARAEVFGEYLRPSNLDGIWEADPDDQPSLILSEAGDEREGVEDIDYRDFGEEGSFIGNYQSDPRRRDLRNSVAADELHF